MPLCGKQDYLINDTGTARVVPIEVKSGKDYTEHSALSKFLADKEYDIKQAVVLSNERSVTEVKGILYMPIYYIMFFEQMTSDDVIIPDDFFVKPQ